MKRNSLLNSLIALALLLACVIGCSKTGSDAGKTGAEAPQTDSNQNAAPPTQTAATEIAGDYGVVGTNPNGSPYRGGLKVTKRGDVYQFHWDAGNQSDGVGVSNGNVVAVAYTGGSDGKGCGVVSYQLLADGTLDGKWGYWGVNEMGTEKATGTGGADLAGAYKVDGKNPNGSAYTGDLSITAQAGGYQFAWSNKSSGFGIKQGSAVSVGVGGTRCGFVAYEIKPGGVLDGVWGGYGTSKTGTEKATKK